MRARDLMETFPYVEVTAPAVAAAQIIGEHRKVGVIVVRGAKPIRVLSGSQVLAFVVPGWVQEDPALARVYDEVASDECAQRLRGRTVGDLLPIARRDEPAPVVAPATTLLACAALMARHGTALLPVVDPDGRLLGAVTAAQVLEIIAPEAASDE